MTPYERVKEWRKKNKEKFAEQQRRYFLAHKDKINAYQNAYFKRKRAEARLKVNTNEVTEVTL